MSDRKEKLIKKGYSEGSEPGQWSLRTNRRQTFPRRQEVPNLGWKVAPHRSVGLFSTLWFGFAEVHRWRKKARESASTCRPNAVSRTVHQASARGMAWRP